MGPIQGSWRWGISCEKCRSNLLPNAVVRAVVNYFALKAKAPVGIFTGVEALHSDGIMNCVVSRQYFRAWRWEEWNTFNCDWRSCEKNQGFNSWWSKIDLGWTLTNIPGNLQIFVAWDNQGNPRKISKISARWVLTQVKLSSDPKRSRRWWFFLRCCFRRWNLDCSLFAWVQKTTPQWSHVSSLPKKFR